MQKILYVPGPAGGVTETTTQLVYNGDGSYTYHNEEGDRVSFSVPQHGAGDPNLLRTAGHMGDLFVDDNTGTVYYHGGASWEPLNMGSITTDTGGPTPTNPANPDGGDIYVDESTGDIYTYNNVTNMWENQSAHISADAGNVLTEGTDGLAYFSGIASGTGAPTATSPANPSPGDIYVDEATGDIYTYNGTEWIPQPGVSITTDTGGPTPTNPANPDGGDIYVDESTGDIYTYNNVTNMWENQSAHISADAGNVLTEGTDGLAYFSGIASGTGAPTATSPANPSPGDIYVDEATGDIYTYNGTEWIPQPGVSITTDTGGPTPTNPANPDGGDIYVDESTGDIYTYNSVTNMWENQSGHISADAGNVLTEGTDGLAYFSGIASGTGAPTATSPANPSPGDIYVDESTGDIYTYNGTEWVPQPGVSITTDTGGPTPTNPANPDGGDIYVDESTGDIYTYNSVTNMWENQSGHISADAGNVLTEGTDGLAYFSGIASGTGAPTATSPANPSPGDIYVDEATGDIYTYNGTEWVPQPGVSITTDTGGPTPTNPANPDGGDIYVDESTGDIYTYNSVTNMWENQSAHISADAGNVLTEGTDGLAYFSGIASGTGAPTATSPANPSPGDIYVDEATGDIYTYNGTEWVPQPGVSITTDTGGPTPTNPANPDGGDIYVDESTGDIYTYNNVTNMWENQSTTAANNGLTVHTDNVVQLGGDLIQPTALNTDATNTLAITGLEDADLTTGDYDIMVVHTTTGVIEKTPASALQSKRLMAEYTAADGEIDFAAPQMITDTNAIDVYRNGVRVDFSLVNATTVKLDLGTLTGCYAGDEIRIVMLANNP